MLNIGHRVIWRCRRVLKDMFIAVGLEESARDKWGSFKL